MKIKTGDKVKILKGKDRGKVVKVLRAYPKLDSVLLEGANMKKRHQRAKKQGKKGQVLEKPAPVHVSNVAKVE